LIDIRIVILSGAVRQHGAVEEPVLSLSKDLRFAREPQHLGQWSRTFRGDAAVLYFDPP
jgi:hypothetical protein